MSANEHFIPIAPRQLKVLKDLQEIRNRSVYGEIGWKALMEADESPEHVFQPLLDRGLIEDLTDEMGVRGGRYFVRITPTGSLCLGLGIMLKEKRKTNLKEMQELGVT